ncbi:hypothetical protein T11_14357 [Trichinella zimbabwensis]|uniref:Uncharacterized protein n=1 Tax=Trichinella zimbabwensis TaxID=268475 RepID=A0A0V1H4A9_9BILA|nr:hypothetical protein T11_14357 [Trichinella zimbabwensis]
MQEDFGSARRQNKKETKNRFTVRCSILTITRWPTLTFVFVSLTLIITCRVEVDVEHSAPVVSCVTLDVMRDDQVS